MASVVLGASAAGAQLQSDQFKTPYATLGSPSMQLVDDVWRLSPNKAQITFTRIDFVSASDGQSVTADLANCSVTYDRAAGSGSTLLDCPFSLQLTSEDGGVSYRGSYIGIYVYYKRTIRVLLNGAASGIYSDPASGTKLSSGPSVGDFVDYEIGGGSGDTVTSQIYFTAPFNVSDSETPTIRIVTDMIHTIRADVSGGVPSFKPNSGETPVQLMAIPGAVPGRSEFYSNAATVESTPEGMNYLFARVFYAADAPVSVGTSYLPDCFSGSPILSAFAVNPATAPLQDSMGNKAGGFLGLSSGGTLAWAFATNWRWSQYASVLVMPRRVAIGDSTVLQCQATSAPPAPANGATYASGTPAITPTATHNLKLLAK